MLTDTKIRSAKPRQKAYRLYDEKGLYIEVSPAGGKLWRLKYRFLGKEKRLALGKYPDTSLKRAREKRDEARTLLADDIDPGAKRKAEKTADDFETVAREWLEKQSTELDESTINLARRRLERWVFPYLGTQPIQKIEPPEVLDVLRRIEAAGKHETAHRVRSRMGQIFRYGIACGKAVRDPAADLKDALSPVVTKNRAAITDSTDVAKLLRAIDAYTGQPSTRAALRLLPLVFLRPGELRLSVWDEIDLEHAIWRIPAVRMKMERDHLVPLSRQAVAILAEHKEKTGRRPYVFESLRRGRPLSENTMNVALHTLGYSSDVMTPHGFRSTASTFLHELKWPPEVIELQLAHKVPGVAGVYNRSARIEERTRMMQAWADSLSGLQQGMGWEIIKREYSYREDEKEIIKANADDIDELKRTSLNREPVIIEGEVIPNKAR